MLTYAYTGLNWGALPRSYWRGCIYRVASATMAVCPIRKRDGANTARSLNGAVSLSAWPRGQGCLPGCGEPRTGRCITARKRAGRCETDSGRLRGSASKCQHRSGFRLLSRCQRVLPSAFTAFLPMSQPMPSRARCVGRLLMRDRMPSGCHVRSSRNTPAAGGAPGHWIGSQRHATPISARSGSGKPLSGSRPRRPCR